jgi:poly(A) polymerase
MSKAGFTGRVFLVGGAIRELALGKSANDYDFALERPEDLRIFERVFGTRSFLLGKKPVQTHRIVGDDIAIDVTILESDIDKDLLRRDFTMNAMAYDVGRGVVMDPLSGWEDLKRRLIRYPREQALKEDPLRMLKAVRHFTVLPGFAMAPEVTASLTALSGLIRETAVERIKYELDLIMLSRHAHRGIGTLAETGLLFEIVPELLPLREMDREKGLDPAALGHMLAGFKYIGRAERFHPLGERETKYVGYAFLFHDLGKARTYSYDEEKRKVHFFYHERFSKEMAGAIMERLKFGSTEARAVSALIENHMRLFLISNQGASEKATRRLVYKMEDLTPCLVRLTLLDLYGSSKGRENASTRQVRRRCLEVLDAHREWRKAPLPRVVTGRDLMALGFAEGPALGRVLQEIREKQIAGEITGKGEALEYALANKEESSEAGPPDP